MSGRRAHRRGQPRHLVVWLAGGVMHSRRASVRHSPSWSRQLDRFFVQSVTEFALVEIDNPTLDHAPRRRREDPHLDRARRSADPPLRAPSGTTTTSHMQPAPGGLRAAALRKAHPSFPLIAVLRSAS
jgi:hypothetical protein